MWKCLNCGKIIPDTNLSCYCGLKKGRHPKEFGAFVGEYDG